MRYLSKTLASVEAVRERERERERESYSLNSEKNACVMPSILNNRIIKGRVILSCGYLDTG